MNEVIHLADTGGIGGLYFDGSFSIEYGNIGVDMYIGYKESDNGSLELECNGQTVRYSMSKRGMLYLDSFTDVILQRFGVFINLVNTRKDEEWLTFSLVDVIRNIYITTVTIKWMRDISYVGCSKEMNSNLVVFTMDRLDWHR